MIRLRPAILAVCLAAALLCSQGARAEPGVASLRAEISGRWHVAVVDHALEQQIVPLVATQQRPVVMQDLSSPNEAPCLQAVMSAFQSYPASFISSLVNKLALADGMTVWNIRVGGFHAPGLIALNCQDADRNEAFDVDSLHDEIAALLLMRAPLDRTAWQAFNPPGFRYGDIESYRAELRNPHGRAGDEALHTNGFVSELGLTGPENDFQTYAERIFGHGPAFAAVLRRYPAMRGKARMVMDLYRSQADELADRFIAEGLLKATQ